MTRALLVIDVQNDYFAGGRRDTVGLEHGPVRLVWFRLRVSATDGSG